MFTGIIETIGIVQKIQKTGTNITFTISSPISQELKIDQSVSHDGVCLTVVSLNDNSHDVTAVLETLLRSNLAQWKIGSEINIERCMKADGRFDGHIVQGHVDTVATVESVKDQNGSWLFSFKLATPTHLLVDKGSVTVNGVSLTCFDTHSHGFTVAIIPYTYEHTNFAHLQVADQVNIEFDIVGKYVERMLAVRNLI